MTPCASDILQHALFPDDSFIDTELYSSSGNEASVRTKTDFGSRGYMAEFPREIGKGTGYDYDTTKYVEKLGADIMLLRNYEPSTFTQPLFFLFLQADTESSFHSLKDHYHTSSCLVNRARYS